MPHPGRAIISTFITSWRQAVNLYLRLLKLLFLLPFVRRQALLEGGRIAFRVWPNDCDLNLHLNNGRYLTFMDLGRVHLLAQIGLLGELWRRHWAPVLSAAALSSRSSSRDGS